MSRWRQKVVQEFYKSTTLATYTLAVLLFSDVSGYWLLPAGLLQMWIAWVILADDWGTKFLDTERQ